MQPRTIEHPTRQERITFLETSSESGGARTLVEVELGPGKAAPAHCHEAQTETFEVIEGTVEVTVNGEAHRIGPGESATAPAGSLHAFANVGSETARFRVDITPGNRGWENMMRASFGLVRDGKTWGDFPKSFTAVAVLATWGQAQLPGPFAVLGPLLRWRARSKAGQQLGAQMLERYGGEPGPA